MHSAYATYGRRIGERTPDASYAMTRRDELEGITAIPAVGPLAPLAAAANGALATGDFDRDTISVGLRYELPSFSVLNGALVKLQFDHIDAKDTGGMFIAVQPGFDGEVNIVGVSFDFIFEWASHAYSERLFCKQRASRSRRPVHGPRSC
jgi:hypothetical protein